MTAQQKLLPLYQEPLLLTEGRDAALRSLVHRIWTDVKEVRKEHSAEAMVRVLRNVRELNKLGYACLLIQKGRVTCASDPRFSADRWQLLEDSLKGDYT